MIIKYKYEKCTLYKTLTRVGLLTIAKLRHILKYEQI